MTIEETFFGKKKVNKFGSFQLEKCKVVKAYLKTTLKKKLFTLSLPDGIPPGIRILCQSPRTGQRPRVSPPRLTARDTLRNYVVVVYHVTIVAMDMGC